MNVLINALGISDSGGVAVLQKLLDELVSGGEIRKYTLLLTKNAHVNRLVENYKYHAVLDFRLLSFKSYMARLKFENYSLRKIVIQENIDLIYNFSGSYQFFIKTPQLVKIQNLLFYSKTLDKFYKDNSQYILWLKHIFFKRHIFKIMLSQSRYAEIQSEHVAEHLSGYVDIEQTKFFIKSDIDVCETSFNSPRKYNFSKAIKILYIVGPHFEHPHKNLLEFTKAMLELKKLNINFEINITLTKEELNQSNVWHDSLNSCTNFHGYITDKVQMQSLFCDNTILVSTSVVETLGLHVIDGIKNGVICIVPNESYAQAVYGKKIFSYKLFNEVSLANAVISVINSKDQYNSKIKSIQDDLKQNEKGKFSTILDVFDEIKNV